MKEKIVFGAIFLLVLQSNALCQTWVEEAANQRGFQANSIIIYYTVTFGDLKNDSYDDVFMTSWGANGSNSYLFINDGAGSYAN